MSIPPNRSTACATAPRPAPRRGCRRRSAAPRRRPPRSARRRCGPCPRSLGCGLAVFAISATLAPSRAARSAIASPIPRLAPEMKIVFPFRLMTPQSARVAGVLRRISPPLICCRCGARAPLPSARCATHHRHQLSRAPRGHRRRAAAGGERRAPARARGSAARGATRPARRRLLLGRRRGDGGANPRRARQTRSCCGSSTNSSPTRSRTYEARHPRHVGLRRTRERSSARRVPDRAHGSPSSW